MRLQSIQRGVIAVLGHQHLRQQPRAGQAALNRPAGRVGLEDALAAHARQLGTHVADDLEAGRHVLELLGHVFVERTQLAAAFTALARPRSQAVGVMHPGLARQVHGQLAIVAARLARRTRLQRHHRCERRNCCLGADQRELSGELFTGGAELLARAAQQLRLELVHQQPQLRDFGVALGHHAQQRIDGGG